MRRSNFWLLAAAVLAVELAGAGDFASVANDPMGGDPASQRMKLVLAAVAAESKVIASFRENTVVVEQLLKAERDGTRKGARLDFELAREHLRAGQNREALVRLVKLRNALRQNPNAVKAEVLAEGNGTSLPESMFHGASIGDGKTFDQTAFEKEVRFMLATANLRIGEQENCIARHGVDSCLFPIKGTGVHVRQEGSRAAIEQLLGILADYPDDMTARWLLNVAYMTVGEYPDKVPAKWLVAPSVFDSGKPMERFYDVASKSGVAVSGRAGGAVLEDFDGDGSLDLVVTGIGLTEQMQYFRNRGDGTFEERTRQAGLTGYVGGANLIHGDFDNDGRHDLLVLRGVGRGAFGHHPVSLLRNNPDGTFSDVTERAGLLADLDPVLVAAWGDFDNDGWLDLYKGCEALCPGHVHPSRLYRNNRDGTFTDVAEAAGVRLQHYVRAVQWGDFDNDGRLDLYAAIEGDSNRLFRNVGPDGSGKWRFEDVSAKAGVEEPLSNFPAWLFDYDGDGRLDIFVGGYGPKLENLGQKDNIRHYRTMRRALFSFRNESSDLGGEVLKDYLGLPTAAEPQRLLRNRGDGTFEDVTAASGAGRVTFPMSGNYGDLDNDGWVDFYVGTGAQGFGTLVPNRLFMNRGGKKFEDVTTAAGMGHLQKGHGVAIGDVDNDGDQDVFIKLGGTFEADLAISALYRNPGASGHWVRLRLEGTQSNRGAIGAKILVKAEGEHGVREHHAWVTSGGSFGSNSYEQFIGLADARNIRSVEVVWPRADQKPELFTGVALDRAYRLREGTGRADEVKFLGKPAVRAGLGL